MRQCECIYFACTYFNFQKELPNYGDSDFVWRSAGNTWDFFDALHDAARLFRWHPKLSKDGSPAALANPWSRTLPTFTGGAASSPAALSQLGAVSVHL